MPDPHAAERNTDAMRKRELAVRLQYEAKIKAERRAAGGKNLVIAALGLGLGWAIYNNGFMAKKLATRDVVYTAVNSEGAAVASTHYEEAVSSRVLEDSIRSAIWEYVQARDCYGSTSPYRQSFIAQAMADQRVAAQFRDSYKYDNPDSPQKLYGDKKIVVRCSIFERIEKEPGSPDAYTVRFYRWEDRDGRQFTNQDAPVYVASVRARTGIYPDDRQRQTFERSTFNPPGVQIIDYPGAIPNNAQPQKPRIAAKERS